MRYILADKMGKPLPKAEIDRFLKEPNILRLAIIDAKDNFPLVHPVWYFYENEKFLVPSGKNGTKVKSIKKNPHVYFLVDVDPDKGPPFGVRGKGIARVIDDSKFATEITKKNVLNYMGSLEGRSANRIVETGKDSSVIEIVPLYMASWKF